MKSRCPRRGMHSPQSAYKKSHDSKHFNSVQKLSWGVLSGAFPRDEIMISNLRHEIGFSPSLLFRLELTTHFPRLFLALVGFLKTVTFLSILSRPLLPPFPALCFFLPAAVWRASCRLIHCKAQSTKKEYTMEHGESGMSYTRLRSR